MGNRFGDFVPRQSDGMRKAAISQFFNAGSWIEGAALQQLEDLADLKGMISVAAFPDLHPGKYGPVGIAALSERLYPQLVGNDIGCGMSLFELSIPLHKFKVDKAANQLRKMEEVNLPDIRDRLGEVGLPTDMFPQSLGTIGGGNHFCELQAVEAILGDDRSHGLDRKTLYLLVHSGSRAAGMDVFQSTLQCHGSMPEGLLPDSQPAMEWIDASNRCVEWAKLNRQLVAERVAIVLRAEVSLVTDMPHNLVRFTPAGFVHFKGAASVEMDLWPRLRVPGIRSAMLSGR